MTKSQRALYYALCLVLIPLGIIVAAVVGLVFTAVTGGKPKR